MGKFRAEAVIIREVNGIRIVFYNHETIYVHDDHKGWVIFHRWFMGRGSYYKGWHQFRDRVMQKKHLDLAECYRLAFQYDVQTKPALNAPDLSKFKIQERFV